MDKINTYNMVATLLAFAAIIDYLSARIVNFYFNPHRVRANINLEFLLKDLLPKD